MLPNTPEFKSSSSFFLKQTFLHVQDSKRQATIHYVCDMGVQATLWQWHLHRQIGMTWNLKDFSDQSYGACMWSNISSVLHSRL